jgi:hypothetical protein
MVIMLKKGRVSNGSAFFVGLRWKSSILTSQCIIDKYDEIAVLTISVPGDNR